MKKIFLFFLIIAGLSFTYLGVKGIEVDANKNDELSNQLKENSLNRYAIYNESYEQTLNYYNVYQLWKTDNINDGDDSHIISPRDMNGGTVVSSEDSYQYGKDVLSFEPGQRATFTVNIQEAGLYQFYLDYYALDHTRLTPKINFLINQQIQFSEMNTISLEVDWKIEDKIYYDRYGDELTPQSIIDAKWYQEKGLVDPNHFFVEPLKFYLDSGENEISIELLEGYILLGDVKITNQEINTISYAEYRNQNPGESNHQKKIKIEAEDMYLKSRQSIRAKYMRDPQVTPYEYKNRVLNVLDGYSYGESGDRVTYEFDVEETGYYRLAVKYYLNTNNGLPSNRRISIDGSVPFKALESYSFKYSSSWKYEVLKDDKGTPYEFYLEKGEGHTLTLSVENSEVRDIYHHLLDVLVDMQMISQEINKITGGLEDKERDWKIVNYIPNLEKRLYDIQNRLDLAIEDLSDYSKNSKIPAIQELKIARELVHEFVIDPEELPSYMSKFTKGESSAYGRINRILPTFIYHPLHLDKMYFFDDVKLPKANANIFNRFYEGMKAFLYSFFDPKYNETAKIDDDTIEIWVNKSRLYVEIMQRMIDEQFTPQTGIKVQLSLMPDENKIILSNAAGSTPDGVMGISFQKPFELAIRGVTEDLRQYDGFYDLAEEFNPNTFIPYIYDEGVYAMPETQDVKLLFYRKDTLSQLEVAPPETWDEVISLVPVLQKYDMNFFVPIGEENSYKGLDKTTPFIYQYGGNLYNPSSMTTAINEEEAFEAFEVMTDLFTIYNLPVTTSNFFQHFRSGLIPVGIGDANMYIQLKYAAPELAGKWGMLPIPGVKNEEGDIERWDPTYGTSSIIFKNSEKKQMTWDLIKWWSCKETQADFSYNIQSTLGNKFLYMTANIEGFEMSAWPSDSKSIILQQWQWIQTTGKVPGEYMLERELSNAWNKVVFDGVNPRIAIDDAKSIIDKELERKLIEFKYMDENGNIIRPYNIPTIHNVENWVRKNEDED